MTEKNDNDDNDNDDNDDNDNDDNDNMIEDFDMETELLEDFFDVEIEFPEDFCALIPLFQGLCMQFFMTHVFRGDFLLGPSVLDDLHLTFFYFKDGEFMDVHVQYAAILEFYSKPSKQQSGLLAEFSLLQIDEDHIVAGQNEYSSRANTTPEFDQAVTASFQEIVQSPLQQEITHRAMATRAFASMKRAARNPTDDNDDSF
jgi:hypothetical protein